MLDELLDRRLIFVTGKGGVGKSTATAGLAQALARCGQRTLVLETDTFSAMEDLFDYESTGLEPVRINDNLHASNLTSEECFIATLRRFVPSKRVARAVVQNKIARVFFKAAPSVNEVTILDQVRVFFEKTDDDGEPFYDHILVDLPASGHAVTFLHVPETMHGMMRGVGPIAKMCRQVADLISDRATTAIIAVCLPEEMPVNETIELSEDITEKLERPLDLAIANMVHRVPIDDESRPIFEKLHDRIRRDHPDIESLFFDGQEGRDDSTAIARLVAGNALALGWADRDRRYLEMLHDRLEASIIEMPIVYESSGAEIAETLGSLLLDDLSDDDGATSTRVSSRP